MGVNALCRLVVVLAAITVGLASSPRAEADIPFPWHFMPYIEGYESYDGQDECFAYAQPGVLAFRDHLNFWYGYHSSSIVRACYVDGQSEHKEGRALDYMINAGDPVAQRILNDLLYYDENGHPQGRARRFGLMYIIFDRKIFRMYRPFDGWQPYDGENPHTDHIHFSFSWPGARKQTSWWTTTQYVRTASCGSSSNRVEVWQFNSIYGPLVQIKAISDVYGRRYDTQAEIEGSPWRMLGNGSTYRANQPVSVFSSPAPRARIAVGGGYCYVPLL